MIFAPTTNIRLALIVRPVPPVKLPPVRALTKNLSAKYLPLQVRMKKGTGRRKKKQALVAARDKKTEPTSPSGQTEGYWQNQGYNPADVAYIMAFGITALLATVVVVVEVVPLPQWLKLYKLRRFGPAPAPRQRT